MSEKQTPETDAIRGMIASRLKPGQQASAEIAGLLRHGFRLERQRDALADALRALLDDVTNGEDDWVAGTSVACARALLAEVEKP